MNSDEERQWFFERGEVTNGRLAMLGIVAAFGAYITTGQLIPGLW